MTLAALDLLAFACHTVLDLLEPPWQAAREAAAKRTSFFGHIHADRLRRLSLPGGPPPIPHDLHHPAQLLELLDDRIRHGFSGFVIFQGFAGGQIFLHFCAALAESRAGRPSATRLRSSRKWRVREGASLRLGLGAALLRRPAPGVRDPFGIAARNDPEGVTTRRERDPAVDRNRSARVGAKREISRRAVTDAAPIAEERSSTIARILVSQKKIPSNFLKTKKSRDRHCG